MFLHRPNRRSIIWPARPGLRPLLPALMVAGLLLAGCGGAGGGGGESRPKTVKIGVIAPLTGDLSAIGVGIRNGVDLAIRQANERGRIPGWEIVLDAQDDGGKPDVGAQVAAKLASDRQVAGVVGTYNSSVAQQVQPILDRANIVMISPGNTNPTLTQGEDLANPGRPYKTYFRVVTTDAIQGPFAANYASRDLGKRTVAVIHDKKVYGQGIAEAFVRQFEQNGGSVLTTETINPGDKDFSAVLSKVKSLNPQLIFYGGEYPEGSLISSQADQQGIGAPIMGGDGIYDPTYVQTAGPAAEGDLATSIGAPIRTLPSGQEFVAAYEEAGYTDDFGAFGAYAYDAANVIIEALAKVLPETDQISDSTRQAVVDAVAQTDLSGVTGPVRFDSFGDTTTKVITVYRVSGGTWQPVKTGELT
ncbi:MAG: branched-chain amino acid ABC transporter substrate-binding protein [Actinomycetota bacterium]|nr:branched-chain amino acid ABC transporter substrate-binding protein [Actinomycetota bacterium]